MYVSFSEGEGGFTFISKVGSNDVLYVVGWLAAMLLIRSLVEDLVLYWWKSIFLVNMLIKHANTFILHVNVEKLLTTAPTLILMHKTYWQSQKKVLFMQDIKFAFSKLLNITKLSHPIYEWSRSPWSQRASKSGGSIQQSFFHAQIS